MVRILVGLAVYKPDRRFLESLPVFSKETSEQGYAHLSFHWVWDKTLVDAQNEIADVFLAGDYDYLLTIEDDHWGFTADMLRACITGGSDVCAISYRNRHFPFEMIPMKYAVTDKNGVRRFNGMNEKQGYHEADLCGFGFTLIARHVFQKLERPFFRLNTEYYKGVGPHATDIDFCDRVQKAGMKITGCFDHLLPHRDITEDKYIEMKTEGVIAKHSMFTHIQRIMKEKKQHQLIGKES